MAENPNAVATISDLRVIMFSYKWDLYISQTAGSSTNYSPIFSTPGYEACKWMIRSEQNSDNLHLYLRYAGTNPDVSAQYKFSTSNLLYKDTSFAKKEMALNFKPNQWSHSDAFKRNHNMPSVKVEITCELAVLPNVSDSNKKIIFKETKCNLSENLGNLFDNNKFSDVTLVAGDYELQAHRNILAARSNVFAAMFENEMEERKSGRVDITDIKPDVLKEMLRFIYTDKPPELSEMASDLLTAADKYALQDLKDMCAKSLCSQLSSETAVQTLILADLHGAEVLKSKAMSFICTHTVEIMNTQVWKNAIAEHPRLIAGELSAALTSSLLKVEVKNN